MPEPTPWRSGASPSRGQPALYIGLMSGTSMDAVDAVMVARSDTSFQILGQYSEPYAPPLKARLELAVQNRACPDELGQLDRLVGQTFASASLGLLAQLDISADSVTAIGSHGQTIRHDPEGAAGFSLQIGDPNTIAERTGITTVADFRRRDIAAGGQGAPLAPGFHAWFFGLPETHRVLLNLGGIANLTLVQPIASDPSAAAAPCPVAGFDTGPANTLMDNWCRRHLGKPFDEDGNWARSGQLVPALLDQLLRDPYFHRPAPKSTGREHFNLSWLEQQLASLPGLDPADVQRTLLELTAVTAASAIEPLPRADVFVCGGGARNGLLMERLRAHLPDRDVSSTDPLGLAPEAVEGAAFAWLAGQTLAGLAGNSPAATGASGPRVLGAIYQG